MYIFTGLLTLFQVYYAALWGSEYFTNDTDNDKKQHSDKDSLQTRMSKRVKQYNGDKCHPYKAHIVSLKSKELLKYINFVCPIGEKIERLRVYNDLLLCVVKSLYKRFDPSVIYCFNNEIHLVFFYNDAGNHLFDGDIMKTVTSIVSHVTGTFSKELLSNSLTLDVHFTGTFVEFDKDYEALNYIIWRQLDCARNNTTLMYKCVKCVKYGNVDQESTDNVTVDEMTSIIEEMFGKVPDFIHYGNVVKKALVYKAMRLTDKYNIYRRIGEGMQMTEEEECEEALVDRKEYRIEHQRLSDNFKASLQKYIVNKML